MGAGTSKVQTKGGQLELVRGFAEQRPTLRPKRMISGGRSFAWGWTEEMTAHPHGRKSYGSGIAGITGRRY